MVGLVAVLAAVNRVEDIEIESKNVYIIGTKSVGFFHSQVNSLSSREWFVGAALTLPRPCNLAAVARDFTPMVD